MLLYIDTKYTSPYAMSVFVALHEKALPFEIVTVDIDAHENRNPGFAGTSITRRIPALVHEDFALSESSAICEYLEDVFPAPAIYPAEPRARARARQVQAWLRSDLLPIREERSTEVMFYGRVFGPLSPAAQASAETLISAANALLEPGNQNLFGRWSIADADLALMLNRLAIHGDPVPGRLADYARHQWERPSVQLWVNQKRPPL